MATQSLHTTLGHPVTLHARPATPTAPAAAPAAAPERKTSEPVHSARFSHIYLERSRVPKDRILIAPEYFKIPIAIKHTEPDNGLDSLRKFVYDLLNVSTITIVADAPSTYYTVPVPFVNQVREELAAGGVAVAAREWSLPDFDVPVAQPLLSPAEAEVYRMLGIDNFVAVHGGKMYTLVAGNVEAAAAAVKSTVTPAPMAIAMTDGGVRFARHYTGPPPPVIALMAELAGVKFVRVAAPDCASHPGYYIPNHDSIPGHLRDVIMELGLAQ